MNGKLRMASSLCLLALVASLQPSEMQAQAGARVGLARALLDSARTSTLYVSSDEVPRFSYSHSVVVNNSRPVKLTRVASGGTDLQSATRAALTRLDAALRARGSTRGDIVQMNVFFVGNSFDQTLVVSTVLDEYFSQRSAYNLGGGQQPHPNARYVDFPVRAMVGMKSLPGNALVAFEPTILDPQTAKARTLLNPSVRSSGPRTVLIGGITAQQRNFLVEGYGDNRVQTRAALRNLEQVLTTVGVERSGVRSVTAFHTQGVDPAALRAELGTFFGNNRPEITLVAAESTCLEGITTMINVEAELR